MPPDASPPQRPGATAPVHASPGGPGVPGDAGRRPEVLARGAGLTAAVLAGALVGHCLAGGHVPGPAVLRALAALLLVVGVLAARTAQKGARTRADERTTDAVGRGGVDGRRTTARTRRTGTRARVAAVLASAGLAVALHPVLAMLATGPAAAAVVDPHSSHAGPAAAAASAAPEGVDLSAYVAAGIDLDAVRAAGTDLEALVAAGLDGPTLAAAGLDPADPHAPHTVAALVAAADRAAVAADPPAADPAAGAGTGAASAADEVVDAATGLTVAGLRLPEVGRQVAAAVTVLVTVLLAGAALALPAHRRRDSGTSAPSGTCAA